MYILNAFSLNMLDGGCNVRVAPMTLEAAKDVLFAAESMAAFDGTTPWESAVGHADTAAVFSGQLERDIPSRRINVDLPVGTRALVGQYRGPRLAEGATELPEGASIQWFLVEIQAAPTPQHIAAQAAQRIQELEAKVEGMSEALRKAYPDPKYAQDLPGDEERRASGVGEY